ncbi:MAG: acetylesterase [Oscillospiraceae bacterium]|jgi:S-formylglutathione hydrolase FrmB|nr:acetylesterase [Oscillospiraceae bacterium]
MAHLTLNFQANSIFRHTTVNVVIPAETMPGMPPRATPYWKTVYLLHGMTGDATDWESNTALGELAQLTDTAFVMPSGDNSFFLDGESNIAKYSQFIGEELVDFTRRLLPLSPKREDTTIAGLSMGGFGAIHNGLKYHKTFGHIVALSSAITIENAVKIARGEMELDELGHNRSYYEGIFGDLNTVLESDKNPATLARLVKNAATDPIDLYFACGWNDKLVRLNREFKAQLDEIGLPYTYEEGAGTHEWAFWTKYLRRGLEHAFGQKIPEGIPPQFNPFYIEKTEG